MIKNILVVFGTRPEAVKMAPLVRELEKREGFNVKICVTGQHREMLDQVLQLFGIKPDYDLNLMRKGQGLYGLTSRVLLGMEGVLKESEPNLILVHGDTTTSFATALAGYYHRIPIGHVEAGLRTGDIYSPWPEEVNRKLTAQIATYHFAPTETSKENLIKENVQQERIVVTGNTVIDSLFLVLQQINRNDVVRSKIKDSINLPSKILNDKNRDNKRIILVTGHRRENFGDGFRNICRALKKIAIDNPDCEIIYPLHLNPQVSGPVKRELSNIDNVHLKSPLTYEPFVFLMSLSYIILTDSGGIQEEAPSLGKPVLVMRNTTERPEAVSYGTVKLVGTCEQRIIDEVQLLLDNKKEYEKMSTSQNPYGNGNASILIANYLTQHL